MISLAITCFSEETARIKQSEINFKDIVVDLVDDNCLEYKEIMDPKTGQIIEGYIFKDNAKCKMTIVNTKATSKPIEIVNYYYRALDGHLIKMVNMESKLSSADTYEIIPTHTYNQLKNANRLSDKLFVLECKYEIVNDELKDMFYNIKGTPSIAEVSRTTGKDFYVDALGDFIERKKTNIYFQLVDDDFFDRYKIQNAKKQSEIVRKK